MLKSHYPLYIGGKAIETDARIDVFDKYTGQRITSVSKASTDDIQRGIAESVNAANAMKALPSYARQDILNQCVSAFENRTEEFANALCLEAGKPIRDARGEVARLIDTFRFAAAESVRTTGQVMDMEISARTAGYSGLWKRVPIGPVSFITPFNFPLNLVAHKIAPAIAMGCPFVLKPASLTPIGALLIGEILAETGLPDGAFSIMPCDRESAGAFTTDPRLKLLSFTGSADVGWQLKSQSGKKRVILELGGNAACIVDRDWDLDDAATRILRGAFYQSGQSCIGVQRVLIHEQIYHELKTKLVDGANQLLVGDPRHESTSIGPLITENEAIRVERWITEAQDAGARLLCGGQRDGAFVNATFMENVPRHVRLYREEVFGPVALLTPFSDFEDAINEVNDSRFGLQAGVFTRDLYKAQQAWDALDVGGVIIGDIPSWRVDHMPYGGVKDSGLGREGIRYSMDDMSEIRLLAIRRP
ncbi:MAG: aldehyde dehydrogenase family protein [Myxococcota bacterium]|nr:aldehyde dehydrogenase family protein [Myxococcota bacterium]